MKVHNNGDFVQGSKHMATLVAAYRRSGLGLRRFAREHKISHGRLHYWVYQKHRNSRPRALTRGRVSDLPPGFQEVKLEVSPALRESWAAEVRLAGGGSVRFSSAATPGWISGVIQALQRTC